jgi:predicted Zn-dependent protease
MAMRGRRRWIGTWWALMALAAGVCPAAAQSSGQPSVVTPQEQRWQADRLFDQGRYDAARDAYLAIYAEFAKDPEFNRDLGFACYRARRPDIPKAIQYWTTSWQLDGKEDLKIEAARAYGRIGQWERGTKLLLDLAAAHPQHPQHWREAAEVAEAAQQLDQAEAWYRTYLARRPRDAGARIALARVLSWRKKYQEALAEFDRVLTANPRSTPSRLGRAQVLAWKGDHAESVRRYDELLREQPANLDAQRGKAFALLWSGKWDEARPLFQAVARRRPNDGEVRAALAEVARLERVATETATAAAGASEGAATADAGIDAAFAKGDGPAAVALVRAGLAARPGDPWLRRRLAQAHLLAGDPGAAIAVLQDLRSARPGDAEVLRELASAQVRASSFPDAIDTLFAYLEARPEDRGARVDVARVLSWSRRFDEATREYQRVLEADPGSVDSLVGLAQVEAWQGRHAEALTRFDEVLARWPDQREARIGRAQAQFWAGSRREALDAFAALEQAFPGDREIATLAADLREADRAATIAAMDDETSIRYHEGELARQPGDADLMRTLAALYLRTGNAVRAVEYYRRVRSARPDDLDAQLALARALAAAKSYVEAASLLRDLVAADPNPSRRLELAQVLASARDYDGAAAVYRQLIDEAPDAVDARLGLARMLSWNRDYAPSLEAYRELLARHPGHRDARVEYARVHAWKGDLDRAVELFSELERDYPDDRDVLLGKGQALQWSGRAREAQRILVPLLERYPQDRDVRVAMAGNQLALGRGDLALQELQVAGAVALEDADVRAMRTLALRQVRPTFAFSFNPSRDSDDLEIFPSAATLYFTPLPRVRSHLRGTFIPSTAPDVGDARGREAVFGATVQLSSSVIVHGEAGTNVGREDDTSPIGGGGITLLPSNDVRIVLDASRQFINYLPLSVERDISRVLLRASLDVRPRGRWLLHLDVFHADYSDDNRANGGNLVLSRAVLKRPGALVEAGYLFSLSRFANDPGNGYYAPSRLQRHAGLVNVVGRTSTWFGYTVAGTLGIEQALDSSDESGFRPDGSLRFSFDFLVGDRLKFSAGYGYSRVASLARAGAYDSHALTGGLEIGF